ncbi:chemoreceptor-like protein with four helix bundle sensory module [Roseivirga pacifica]|uniref:Four helix bundle sensory module for signal transduction n=1 Tax=Roseivirga pacifica TaxID=1267423 RepID=A0A1I0R7F0_9BACT|nr:MCP four helix bundle domain-containing protein [Roseivirga pacifica]RKQ49159.1 chemoreceptor-like protein with four helix bundle sensory module [Roseivirga pacifica]SEW36622.1 Four helix bundle sensory module for signal transduction [Roseivirga pacifica]
MKWTYSIRQKMTAAGILAAVMGLVLINNLSERRNFQQLEDSIASIYQDRLLVESYIFKLYDNLQRHDELLDAQASAQTIQEIKTLAAERNALIALYEETYITEEEAKHFDALKKSLSEIEILDESTLANNKFSTQSAQPTKSAITHLSALSQIQTTEGASLMDRSERIIGGSISNSQLEMVLVICLAIIVQALVFSSKSLKAAPYQDPSLN